LRANFDPNAVQRSTLLSIKTGNCSEDCGYCSQSKRYQTGLETQRLLSTDEVLAAAKAAKEQGAGRFCMGAAWRGPKEKDMAAVAGDGARGQGARAWKPASRWAFSRTARPSS
jgi:biotin synthase